MVKKVKKSPFAYNNRYADGYQILQGVRERNALTSSAIQEPYNTGSFQTVSTEDAPELSFYEKYGNYPELDEDGNILQKDVEDENDIPYYKRPLKWASDFVKNTADDWNNAMVSPADVWRQTLYKGFEAHLGSIQTKQMNNKWEIESLDEAQMYLDQITKVQQLTKELELSKSRQANPTWIDNIDKQLQSEISKLNSIEKDIQNKWRDSDSFLRMFTNFGKIDAEQNENGLNWGWRAIKPTRRNEAHGFWDTTKAVVGDVGSFLTNTFSNLGYSIGDVLHLTSDKAATVRNIIKNTDKNDAFINQYFKGYKSANNIDEYKNNVQNMINILKNDRERESKELEASQLSTINTLRNGNWAFDPRKIDPIYKKKQEENNGSLLDFINPLRLPYAIPEMGSSYSDLQTSLAMLGTEQGFAWAGELLNPGKKGKLAMGLLGMGTGLAIAKKLREEETGSEVSDAYAQRLVEELYKNRSIDANKVLDSINNFAKALGGLEFNPDELDLQKKMALALSYNIKTGDPIFDKFSIDARNGLKKVYNENMSLSTMNYIEAIPFMNYTRSVMKEMAGAPLSKLMSKLGNTKVGAFASKAADKYRTVTQAMTDKTITKLFGKDFERTSAKLRTLHALQWVKNLAKKGMFTGFVEGVEEGQQQLLQSRYMRGEYDDYDSPYFDSPLFNPATLFDIPSSIKDLELGTAALGCYLGINFGDPDNGDAELRKAMTTGAVTGMMFSGLHALGISNLQRAHMDPNNLRALHRQFQNDAVLAKMVGENYGAAQDDAHIATFFGAMDRKGLNRSQLEKSLNDFKRFKGEMVKDEYIDRDIDLLNNTYFAYNNSATNDILNNLNIRRGSDDHLKVVQNAVRAFMDYDTLSDKIKDQQKRASDLSDKINSIVDFYLDGKEDEGAVPEDIKNLRTSLKPIIDELRKQYTQYQLEAKANNDVKKQELLNDEKFVKKVKDEFGYDDKINSADSEEAKSKVNEEYQKKLDETINSQLSIADEKSYVNSSLNMVFEARKAQQIKKILDLFDNRHKIAKEIEKEFGIDLNADRLANVVDNMREVYKNITSENNKKLKSENDRRAELNKLAEKLNAQIEKENAKNKGKKGYTPRKKHKLYTKATIQSIVKDLDPLLGDTKEYDSIIKSIFINNAVLKLYQPYMEAYSTGQANPYDVKHQTRPLRWSELSKDQQEEYANKLRKKYEAEGKDTSTLTSKRLASSYNYEQSLASVELEKLANRQKKLIDDFNHKDEQDRTASEELLFSEEIKDIRSKAAQQLIEDDLNKKRERQRIAHKEFLEDGGLTTDDIDNAENGDEKSSENVKEATSEEKPAVQEQEDQPEHTESPQPIVTDDTTTPQPSAEEQPQQPESGNPFEGFIKQHAVDGGLLDTETSPEDLVDEEMGQRKPKRKAKDEKPKTKEDVVDDIEKPGTAEAAKVDTPSSEEVQQAAAGETKQPEKSDQKQHDQLIDVNKGEFSVDEFLIASTINALFDGQFDIKSIFSNIKNVQFTVKGYTFNKYEDIIEPEYTRVEVLDKNKKRVKIKIPSYAKLHEPLHDGEYICSVSFNRDDNTYYAETSEYREVAIDINQDEYNKQRSKKETSTNRNVNVGATIAADQLKSGKIKLDNISNLEEGGYNLSDGFVLRVSKSPEGTMVGITKYVDKPDGSTDEEIVQIQIPYTHTTTEELEEGEEIVGLMVGTDGINKVATTKGRVIDLVQRGVSVDPNQNMSNPEAGEKNIDKNTGNEKDTTNSTIEEDSDISDATETSTEPEDNIPTEAPINTDEQPTKSNDDSQEIDVDDSGNVFVNDKPLTDEEARQLDEVNFQMDLRDLESVEVSGSLILNDEDPDYHIVQNSDQVKRDFLSQTFFYNNKATQPPYLRVNGKDVHLKYPIQTGAQLAQKLLQKGWFEKTTKFYVVSGNTTTNADELTVSMVIYDEEEEKSYVTYMRTPSGEDLTKLTNSLLFIGVNRETDKKTNKNPFRQNLQDSIEYYFGIYYDSPEVKNIKPSQLSTRAKLWYEGRQDLDGREGKNRKINRMINESIKDQIEDNARKRSSNGKSKVLTRQEIRDNIKQLKHRRQEIIDACCTKNAKGEYVLSTEVNDSVKPKNPRISNGRLQSRKRNPDNSPAFHVLFGKENNLGISSNPEELQRQIDTGEVEFGFGKGMFGEPAFSITSLDGTVQYNGKGLAGKLYLIYKTPNGKIPIMLREQRFNQMPNGSLELSIDPSTGKFDGAANGRPSDAEILLYLLTGKLNEQYYPNQDKTISQVFCDLFINNGEHTTNTTKNTSSALKKFSYYAKKQISWDYNESTGKYELTIVLPDDNGNLIQRHITSEQLFTNTPKSIELRKQVVSAIANNMHFNTDLEQLTEKLKDGEITSEITKALGKHFDRTGESSFSFCGSNILAFKKSDLFDKDGNVKDISVLTWLISTGKLMSDIAKQPLADPFVFATGVEVSQQKQVIKTERNKSKGKDVNGKPLPSGVVSTAAAKENERKKFDAFPADKKARVATRFGIYKDAVEKGVLFASDAETRASLLDKFKDSEYGGLKDQLIVDLSDNAMRNPASVQSEIEQKIQEYVKATGFKLTEIKFDSRFKNLNSRLIKAKIPYVQVRNNGQIYVTLKDIKGDIGQTVQSLVAQGQNRQVTSQMVTGVFSTEKGSGKFNENKARKWLANILGIDDSKIIVLNGVLRSIYNEEVYGVMQQSVDSLNEPVFLFSNEAGQGVEFHEAWHYVNLLLHNRATRSAIYRAYCKKHPELKDKPYKEIEELLAEEYRKYAIMRNDNSIGNVIKRWFNNVYDFCTLNYRNKELIRSIFNNINTGKYKNKLINNESLSEFKRRYAGQVAQSKYQIPTVDNKTIDKMKYIDTYHKFYMVAEALANKMIDYYAINRIEDIKGLKEDSFKEFLDDLKQTCDDDIRGIVDDIYNNPSAFYSIVQQAFMQYGISIKIKKLKQLKQDEQGKVVTGDEEEEKSEKVDVGDRADNSWDVFQFGESKKDNVANRAKLFLTHIQRARLEIDPDNLDEKVLVYETDPLLNSPVYVPFGEAWTKITSEMWDIESYADMDKDNNYLPTSFRGKVKQRAKYEWFYRVLDKKLDELDGDKFGNEPDIEMQNQIYSTVKSQQAQMTQIWLEDNKRKFTVNSEFEDVIGDDAYLSNNASNDDIDDVDRNWNIIDDNGLRAKRSLPRQWSNTAMLSGLVAYERNKTVVNKDFVKHIGKQFTDIKNILNGKYTSVEQYQDAYDNASDKFIDLLNYMCIPCDNDVFDYIIDSQIKLNKIGDVVTRFDTLDKFIKNTTSGSIGSIISSLSKSAGFTELSVGKGGTKDISKIYMGYKTDSQICLLAEAYNSIHPASQDFSVKGPDGSMHYPISQNNHMSDVIRQLNIDQETIKQKMRSPYAKNSILFNIAKDLSPNAGKDEQFRLNAFIGMRDTRVQKGQDYFGINNIEDFLSKMQMTFNNMLTLPTMADKKTWYAIKQKSLCLPHDLITYDIEAEDGSIKIRRFSNNTLDIFAGYFMDELNAVKQYYSRNNIAYLKKHKNSLRDNFHGKFKKNDKIGEERLEFGGNGGFFRYMYGIDMSHGCNLNQYLEALYNQQRKIEENPKQYGGVDSIKEGKNELDGFELVRKALLDIESKFKDTETLRTAINDNILMPRVDDTISALTSDTDYKLGFMLDGQFHPDAIPSHILNWYGKEFSKHNVSVSPRAYSDNRMINNLGLSAIANHTAATMISIIELEKVFSGDPAFYKWKYQKSKQKVRIYEKGMTFFSNVKILKEKDSDKIKRLGALLSPGANIRTDYSEDITNNPKYKGLKGDKYTVLNINDFQSESVYLGEAKQNFARQSAIEYLRLAVKNKKAPWLQSYLGKNGYKNAEELFTKMYQDFTVYDQFMDVNNHAESFKPYVQRFINAVNDTANMSASPYSKITISDAQVIIRPALYRKIRIGIGRWSFEEDETGYSDEKAYQILEKDGSWMTDPEKAAIVSKLQLFPLKMSYFQNDSTILSSGKNFENRINLPIYDKMAIFPMFKYMTRSSVGRALYDRMNKSENEIDMITFESAVKVGDNQNRFTPYKNLDDDPSKDFNFKDLSLDSDKHLDENNSVVENKSSKTLAISVQSLNGLRWQLNTDAHEAESRGIGSQMFKIAFSNILDNENYCINKYDKDGKPRKLRKGRDIKHDIMSCINALTYIGAKNIEDEFDINNNIANPRKAEDYVRRITRSNGLGYPSQDIIDNYGIAASLTSRKVFEQGASSLVNGEVVKINTKGGSAVQQSIFGLTGFNREHIAGQDEAQGFYDEDGYHVLNGGKEIKWIAKNNTMEVMLSINFFRAILPRELRNASYKVRRQWLIDHDIIYGVKSESYQKLTDEQKALKTLFDTKIEEMNLSLRLLKILQKHNVETFKDVIDKHEEYARELGEKLTNELSSELENFKLDFNTDTNINAEVQYSNPMPIGIGYRIPTQGMSSMFGFICADVLPEQSGDLIIVPREFTSQTGSDFDVDKLFIAMKSYTNGVYDDLTKEQRDKIIDIYNDKNIKNKARAITQFLLTVNPNAIQNRLLDDYLDIITDIRNFDNARASIDTITAKIQTELLPLLQMQSTTYRDSGYELTPTYQLRRKMEFTTGKSGIGPFALNITNMALTQFVKLTMRYDAGVQAFNFGDLYEITGQDGLRIADWLSAMVNAHVDVAKDPYIFDMNINSATYKFVNFLLRAGKGLSTFTFIGQPAIKDLANLIQNANGMYGNNIKSRQLGKKKAYEDAWDKTFKKYATMLKAKIDTGDFSEFNSDEEKTKYITTAIELYKSSSLSNVDKDSMNVDEEFGNIFNLSYAKSILQNPYSIKGLCHQILALQAYLRIGPYADELSNLVKVSRIDTEKFGNNIADQINFKNTFNNFKYGRHKVQWYISQNGERMTKKELDKFAETHGQSYALRKYFGSTFLDSKLHLATDLTKIILRNQLCTATDVFEELFTSFFGAVNGVSELNVEKPTQDGKFTSNTQLGYKDVYKQESVAAVSGAIDNIMRYRILRNAQGVRFNSENFDYTDYAGPIDFTCGNNPQAVSENMKRLLFGDPNGKDQYSKNDLFKNLAQVIDMLEHTASYKNAAVAKFAAESGLLDIDGKLNNEFLKFLRPQTASAKFPIGRMLLAKSSFGITGQEESNLVSAFNDLLENRNPIIRRLARDLAFYAYYSAYDTNGVNSFFKFVPAYYRQQYDRALKHALMQNKSNLYDIIKNVTKNNPAGDINGTVLDDFIDKICRNYWYDDNIVPVCKPYNSQKDLNNGGNIVTLSPQPVSFKPFGQMAPETNTVSGVIISSVNGDSPFIKVQKGRQWYLYKLIGHIQRRSGKSIKPYGVYVVINKRGIHEGGIHQYEFNTSTDEYSIFKQNRLPDTLSLLGVNNKTGMLEVINNYIQGQINAAPVNKDGEKTVQYTFTPMENTFISFRGYYGTGAVQNTADSILTSNDGNIRFIYTTNVESELNKCDITLDLTNKDEINKQLDYIKNTYGEQNTNNTSKSYTIAVKGSLQSVQIADTAVNNYIKILADQYKQALLEEDPNINTELMQQQIDDYKNGLNKEEIKTLLSQARINNSVQTVLDTVSGIIPIRAIYSTGESGVAEAATKYAQQHSTEFEGGQPAYVILNKKDVNKQGKNKLIEFVNKFNITDDLYTLSNKEYENLKTIQDVIETTEKELNSDITQQQAIQEETRKKIDTPAIQQDDLDTSNEATQNVTSLSGLFTGGIGGIVQESEQKENSEDKDNYSEGC